MRRNIRVDDQAPAWLEPQPSEGDTDDHVLRRAAPNPPGTPYRPYQRPAPAVRTP